MKLRVQGETYDSPAEVLTAIGELSAAMEDMPESSKERADVERHIGRLKAVVADAKALLPRASETATGEPGADSPPEPQGLDSPPALTETPDEDDDEDNVPPGYILCPVCLGGGMLTLDAPISHEHERCPDCNGYGKVLTGSHVEGHVTADCGSCQGSGWIRPRAGYEKPSNGKHVATAPLYPGATWNAEQEQWDAPPGEPPWSNAAWNALVGAYE